MNFPEHPALRLGIALGIGLLIGAERERRKGAGRSRLPAGIRTFALTALAGGIAVLVGGELLLAASAASVAAFSVIAYRRTSHSDPGLLFRRALTEQEAHDALLFAAASLVVLPLMPNHTMGPYSVLNPRRFWELVVLI